jgi:hypothetical protein
MDGRDGQRRVGQVECCGRDHTVPYFRSVVGWGVDLHFKLEGSERVDRRRRRREFQILKSRLGASFDSTVVGVG